MKFKSNGKILLIINIFSILFYVSFSKMNLRSMMSNNSYKNIEPRVYTSDENHYLNEIDDFHAKISAINKTKYTDILMLTSNLNNNDAKVNNSGTKDHLFRFTQKNNKYDQIDLKKFDLLPPGFPKEMKKYFKTENLLGEK